MEVLNKLRLYLKLDSLIPSSMISNTQSHYRARLFITLLALFVGVLVFAFVALTIFSNGDFIANGSQRLDRSIIVLIAFSYSLSAYLFFAKQQIFAAACILLLSILAGISVGSYFLVSDFNILSYVVLMLPVVGFLLIGKGWGVLYASLAIASQVFLVKIYLSHVDSFVLIQPHLAGQAFIVQLAMSFVIAVTVFVAVMLYELTLRGLNDQLKVERRHYRTMEINDELTELPGKEAFETKVAVLIKSKVRFAIVYLDIDDFQRINNIYGPKAGNELLAIVGKRLKAAVRGNDFVARIDGDQFAIVLKDVAGRNKALERDEEIYKRLLREIGFAGQVEKISISRGLAIYPDDEQTYKALMSHADASMYEQKKYTRRELA
ncbi:MAG: diguanylate cyclase (GGDEF)-like protein [Pseudomonadales bacterium]|jgi:diguanylate cyclase (GGDEF)-like protein